jgi:hypothetical protein
MLEAARMGDPKAPGLALRLARLGTAVACTAVALLAPSAARAYESEVHATVDAQYYAVQSPFGEPILRRRRYTDTLALSLDDLLESEKPLGPSLSFRSRLRLDADFGIEPAERDPASPRYVPGLEQAPLDLMYAYLEGERHLGGLLAFRVGRQYVVDALGFWSFDGALLALDTPAYMRLELLGGFEQRAGLPLLTTPRYQADGVARGSREALRSDQWTSYLGQKRVAPAFGAALESIDLGYVHARASYRRVINRDTVVVSPFADELGELRTYSEDRVSTEKVSGSLRVESAEFGAATATAVYDLYAGVASDLAAGVDWYATSRVTLGADVERIVPTFDGDSIFNWFERAAMSTATARADWRLSRRADVAATVGVRLFETLGDPEVFATGDANAAVARQVDPFASLAGRYRYPSGTVSARGVFERGARGHRYGGDITTTKSFHGGFYDTRVVLSLYDWQDALMPDRRATSFSYVLGGGMSPGIELLDVGHLGFEWEHAMNRLVGQRFRALATLDLSVLK